MALVLGPPEPLPDIPTPSPPLSEIVLPATKVTRCPGAVQVDPVAPVVGDRVAGAAVDPPITLSEYVVTDPVIGVAQPVSPAESVPVCFL